MFTDLKNSFTSNWVINLQWRTPSQLKCMAVLSCVLLFITMHISDCHQFSGIHISQGSVTTYLKSDAIFRQNFVANLPASLPVKEFRKLLSIWGSYGQEFNVLFFIDSRCSVTRQLFNWSTSILSLSKTNCCNADNSDTANRAVH